MRNTSFCTLHRGDRFTLVQGGVVVCTDIGMNTGPHDDDSAATPTHSEPEQLTGPPRNPPNEDDAELPPDYEYTGDGTWDNDLMTTDDSAQTTTNSDPEQPTSPSRNPTTEDDTEQPPEYEYTGPGKWNDMATTDLTDTELTTDNEYGHSTGPGKIATTTTENALPTDFMNTGYPTENDDDHGLTTTSEISLDSVYSAAGEDVLMLAVKIAVPSLSAVGICGAIVALVVKIRRARSAARANGQGYNPLQLFNDANNHLGNLQDVILKQEDDGGDGEPDGGDGQADQGAVGGAVGPPDIKPVTPARPIGPQQEKPASKGKGLTPLIKEEKAAKGPWTRSRGPPPQDEHQV